MAWTIKWDMRARKEFDKLDRSIRKKILNFLIEKISPLDNPRVFGKPLSYEKFGLWRYRMGDHRIICRIDDVSIHIVVVKVGHRKEVYDE